MNIYKLKGDPKLMGEIDPQFGGTFWGYSHESDLPIMFNSHNERMLDGMTLVAEEQEVKTSGSGNEYLRLKKVKIADSGSEGVSVVPSRERDAVPTPSSQPTQVPRKPVAAAPLYNPNYAKDLTDMPVRLYTANLNYAKDIGLNLVDNKEDRRKYLEYIQDLTEELLTWIQNIRGGEDIKKTADDLCPEDR